MAGLFPCDWSQPQPLWRHRRPAPLANWVEQSQTLHIALPQPGPGPGNGEAPAREVGSLPIGPVPGTVRLKRTVLCPAPEAVQIRIPAEEQCAVPAQDPEIEEAVRRVLLHQPPALAPDPRQLLDQTERVCWQLDAHIEQLNHIPKDREIPVRQSQFIELLMAFSKYSHAMADYIRRRLG